MRAENEIKKMLKTVEDDKRLHYRAANVFVNAPLALIQVELETKRKMLLWVLDENLSRHQADESNLSIKQ